YPARCDRRCLSPTHGSTVPRLCLAAIRLRRFLPSPDVLPSRRTSPTVPSSQDGGSITRLQPTREDPLESLRKLQACPHSPSPYPVPPGSRGRGTQNASPRARRCCLETKMKYC